MVCKFMENSGEKLTPGCKDCKTYFIWCRNPKSPVFGAKLTTRQCCKKGCIFYVKARNAVPEGV